jgi:tetratricopeptide (TPR) repeat protein
MRDLPFFVEQLGIEADADERGIKRAYARALKLIDQQGDPAAFQELREAYEAAMVWQRYREAPDAEEVQSCGEASILPDPDRGDAWGLNRDDQAEPATVAADAVFSEFRERFIATAPEMQLLDAVVAQLQECLDDPRLINISARLTFEQHIADLLAGGWQAGHHVLFVAALRVFEWGTDRRRVLALGGAGYMLNAAVEERTGYEAQAEGECELQRQVIARLREPGPPTTAELLATLPRLTTLAYRFPNWLGVITKTAHIDTWHALDAAVPWWRRKLEQVKLRPMWPIVIAIFALIFLFSLAGGSDGPAQANVPQGIQMSNMELANDLIQKDEYAAAIAILNKELEARPDDVAAYAERAWAYLYLRDNRNAAADLAKGLLLAPDNARLHRGAGLVAYNEKRYGAAIDSFSRALKLDHESAHAFMMRAQAYEMKGMADEALADATESIRLDAELFLNYGLRSRIYQARGDKAMALKEADAALDANGSSEAAINAATSIQLRLGERAAARATLERAVKVAPSLQLYLFLARVVPAAERVARRDAITAALMRDENSAEALTLRAELDIDDGRYADAVAGFQRAIDDESTIGDRAKLIAGRGLAYAKSGDRAAADADFKLAQAVSTASDLNNLCWYLASRNVELEWASSSCNAALAREPASHHAIDSKAFVEVRLKRYQEAVALYNRALEIEPRSSASLYGRAYAKIKLGDLKGGRADLQEAKAIAPAVAGDYAEIGIAP